MCGVCDPFNRLPFREGERELHDAYAALAAARNAAPALATGYAEFQAANADVLLILRWIRDGKDLFGQTAEDGVYLTVVNRGDREAAYLADCRAAGLNFAAGTIGPCTAETRRLA